RRALAVDRQARLETAGLRVRDHVGELRHGQHAPAPGLAPAPQRIGIGADQRVLIARRRILHAEQQVLPRNEEIPGAGDLAELPAQPRDDLLYGLLALVEGLETDIHPAIAEWRPVVGSHPGTEIGDR